MLPFIVPADQTWILYATESSGGTRGTLVDVYGV